MYQYLQKILFCLPPEKAHSLGLKCLKFFSAVNLKIPENPVELLGLRFRNTLGLAAGFDKNGDHIDDLARLGFGFIEVGTVTPLPQEGNPKPRLFRLSQKKALINRMGFNNKGVNYLVEKLKKSQHSCVIGVNIGKNATTPLDEAIEDYVICFKKVYAYADYITINISSPNTPNLRELQQDNRLNQLLLTISAIRQLLEQETGIFRPVFLKISPDETPETLKTIVDAVMEYSINGIIATNTTINKTDVEHLKHGQEKGGLSGKPLLEQSNCVLKILKNLIDAHPNKEKSQHIILIGVGGIQNKQDVLAKLNAGAQLVQVYTGLIYNGPFWIKKLIQNMSTLPKNL